MIIVTSVKPHRIVPPVLVPNPDSFVFCLQPDLVTLDSPLHILDFTPLSLHTNIVVNYNPRTMEERHCRIVFVHMYYKVL
jgi:hypothetical protein